MRGNCAPWPGLFVWQARLPLLPPNWKKPSPTYFNGFQKNKEGTNLDTPKLFPVDRSGAIGWIYQASKYHVHEAAERDLAEARNSKMRRNPKALA
jgi:hypothetical protein